jgi:hypothetical protein
MGSPGGLLIVDNRFQTGFGWVAAQAKPRVFRRDLLEIYGDLFLAHRVHSSSASRLTAGALGFLLLIQSGDRHER